MKYGGIGRIVRIAAQRWTERKKTMSCDKWAYSPEKCDGDYCPGDCDLCNKADEFDEDEEEERAVLAARKGEE